VVVVTTGQAGHGAAQIDQPSPFEESDEPLMLREFATRLGQTLECGDGEFGKVKEVLYDYLTGSPLWLGVFEHVYSVHAFLVPARGVRATNGHLATRLTRSQIIGQPAVSVGEGFNSFTEEEAICRYFGLPFDEVRDTRVLRRAEDYPGRERNAQHILASELPAANRHTEARAS
jgi:hypothetical protein